MTAVPPFPFPLSKMLRIRPPTPAHLATPRRRKILAICGDTQVGLSMLRSLARGGLSAFVVCNSPQGQSAHSRHAAGAWMFDRSPDAPPPVDQLEALAKELDVGSIMPVAEGLHKALIEHRRRFEPEVHVFSPGGECFEKATDKAYLHALCQQLGIPVARGTTLDRLAADPGEPLRFPLVLRTARQNDASAAGRAPWKAGYARDQAELDKLRASLDGFADNIIVQEYHPGVEDHIHILMHQGEPFMVGEYIGEHHAPLAGGVTVQRVSCRHEGLARDAVRLLQALNWEGIATCQFHYDPKSGEYIFLEINPRMCGGQPTVIMAGFDSPFLLWQSHFEPDGMRTGNYRLGLRTRILGGDANWLLGMIGGEPLPPDQKRLSKLGAIARFVWNCGPWTKDDSFAWSDPKPFFVDLKQMILKRLKRSEPRDLLGVR
ncbi:MAG: ATP-grasp domain-containing protein [Pirellulales bacterium]|nr:ATP-grasp domain-containing protein [Thermoguttaceae bacterium]MDD4789649.1 ATP-grasp domain-containing protein [Pirellulales bacterium]